jgi:hypothetical protein
MYRWAATDCNSGRFSNWTDFGCLSFLPSAGLHKPWLAATPLTKLIPVKLNQHNFASIFSS